MNPVATQWLAVASPPLAFVVALSLLSWLLGPGRRWMPVDHPNGRSLHSTPTPRSGGVAVIGASLLAVPVAVLALGWAINLYNFMDGADGLSGGMTAIGFSALAAPDPRSRTRPATIAPAVRGQAPAFATGWSGQDCCGSGEALRTLEKTRRPEGLRERDVGRSRRHTNDSDNYWVPVVPVVAVVPSLETATATPATTRATTATLAAVNPAVRPAAAATFEPPTTSAPF